MDINFLLIIIQCLAVIITLLSVIVLVITVKSNKNLNQRLLFNETVKQERELRIKLSEYREEIHKRQEKSKSHIEINLDYDTLLFNYYEYLAICLYQKLINEKECKFYFKDLLVQVKEKFDQAILFKGEYAEKEQYKALL